MPGKYLRKTSTPVRVRGIAAVEFALSLPAFVAVVSGVLDLGWYLAREEELVEIVRDAARAGSAEASGQTTVAATRARNGLTYAGFDSSAATVAVFQVNDGAIGGDVLTVDVRIPFTPLVGLVPVPARLGDRVSMPVQQ